MEKDVFTYRLIDLLKRKFPNEIHPESGGNEFVIRCRFCGDSKNQRNSHFYISPGSLKQVPLYHCFLCNASGILTGKVLLSLIGDSNLTQEDLNDIKFISESINSRVNIAAIRTGHDKLIRSLIYKYSPNPTKNTLRKIEYINNRLHISLTPDTAQQQFKIVCSIKELLEFNSIKKFTRAPDIIKNLDEHFIGFLSLDNGFLTMRNIDMDGDFYLGNRRYINYNIFGANGVDHMRYYCIPTRIDNRTNTPVTIHIAEGCFDILSIKHMYTDTIPNSIYIASNGKGYFNVLKTLLTKYGFGGNVFIHIYPDADVSDDMIKSMVAKITMMRIPITIHRNMYPGEKDFGVPIDRIDERIYSI